MKTKEEIDIFKNSDLKLTEIQMSWSIKSAFYHINKIIRSLGAYLVTIKSFIIDIYETFDISNILALFKQEFEKNKNFLTINYNQMLVGSEYTMQINGSNKNFKVVKKDTNSIHISIKDESDWETTNLLVYVKNHDGETLYPLIKTIKGEIVVSFAVEQYKPIRIYWI